MAMEQPTAHRTLVKSPPELWAEISDLEALARHLGEFGEIRITRLEPETTVAWEGDRARGTVRLEPSGWGTKVTLTAELAELPAEPEPEAVAVAEPQPVAEPEPPVSVPPPAPAEPEPEAAPEPERRRLFARLFGRRRPVVAETEPLEPVIPDEPEPEPAEPGEPAPDPQPRPLDPEPDPDEAPEPAPAATALDGDRATAILTGVLDDLGAAHHRPFSRG